MQYIKVNYKDHGFEAGQTIVMNEGRLRSITLADSLWQCAVVSGVIDKDNFTCFTNSELIAELDLNYKKGKLVHEKACLLQEIEEKKHEIEENKKRIVEIDKLLIQ